VTDTLRDNGYRLTGPRRSLAGLISKREGHFTAADLIVDARRQRLSMGRATIFRTLELLTKMGALERLDLPLPREEGGALVAHVLITDRFGNASLNVDHEQLAGSGITLGSGVEMEVAGERYLGTYAQTFADVAAGELLVYEDAYRTLAVAINRGDAATALRLEPDAEVGLRPR